MEQIEKLLSGVCSQPILAADAKKLSKSNPPAFMIFVPRVFFARAMNQWTGDILFPQPSESTKLSLNSTELPSLHLVVNRHDHWSDAVDLFLHHMGPGNIRLVTKLARNVDIRSAFEHLLVCRHGDWLDFECPCVSFV